MPLTPLVAKFQSGPLGPFRLKKVQFCFPFRAFLNEVDMNISDYDGRTSLHLTAAEGHLDCVRFLLEICHVDPDPKDRYLS